MLLVKNMLCSKFHYQKGFDLNSFSYKIVHDQPPVLINPSLREGECLLGPSGGLQRRALCYIIEACTGVPRS